MIATLTQETAVLAKMMEAKKRERRVVMDVRNVTKSLPLAHERITCGTDRQE